MDLPIDIKKKLKELNIGIIYLFGSTVLGIAKEHSDIDIGVVFIDPSVLEDVRLSLEIYNTLYGIFSTLFPKKEIDIVFLDKVPLTLKFEVVNSGEILYSISKDFLTNYKERVVKEYIDFKPLMDEQDKILLKRLK
ncbi:type VII toxin-antitoxin system MntA family adenylyltransferase antitoxin [Dictyoglomus turgidum]|uniref:type VII toxin-antitoxin system MntA family adenylyltransferase antitoxin n=1 Tax=Dictyoglomus TaxID=13 RepID=UPI00235327C2|nr:nucleotidyltransferase domain-containing protein [Dictyoglomus turgidum]